MQQPGCESHSITCVSCYVHVHVHVHVYGNKVIIIIIIIMGNSMKIWTQLKLINMLEKVLLNPIFILKRMNLTHFGSFFEMFHDVSASQIEVLVT